MSAVKYKEVIQAMLEGERFKDSKGATLSYREGVFVFKKSQEVYSHCPFPISQEELEGLEKLDNPKELRVGDIRGLRKEKFLVTSIIDGRIYLLAEDGETAEVFREKLCRNNLVSRNESIAKAMFEFATYMEEANAPR